MNVEALPVESTKKYKRSKETKGKEPEVLRKEGSHTDEGTAKEAKEKWASQAVYEREPTN